MKATQERVTINVSGDIYETYRHTLQRYPMTLLGDKESLNNAYCRVTDQYFFNRNRKCFGNILFFFQSYGKLRCPPDIKLNIFETECRYFQIPDEKIEEMKFKEGVLPDTIMNDEVPPASGLSIKMQIWNFMEMPQSSPEAYWFAWISFLLICISILTVCLETIPSLKHATNFATNPFAIVELLLNSWFLVELLVRFTFAPSKMEFLHDSLNWIDACAVIPYFFTPFFSNVKVKSLAFLRILKFVRIMRLFRLSKQSIRLKVVGAILKSSVPEFQLIVMCLSIAVILGGSVLYFLEKGNNVEVFYSIPQSLWWCVQALTTVGYGDIVPITPLGKLFSSFYMIVGALTVCLAVLPIVSKFLLFYERNIETCAVDTHDEVEQNVNKCPDDAESLKKGSGK